VPARQSLLQSFGQLIVERRKALGISQEELAHRADLDRTYVSGLERGVRNPSLTAIVKVAHGLGITADKLLKGLEDGAKAGRQR
jgi:transcriptional regulator with XRE-family HTH domain